MNLEKIKSILLTAGILLIVTTAVFPQSNDIKTNGEPEKELTAESAQSASDIEGSWRATVTPEGFAPFQALLTFGKGGGVVGSAQGDILLDPPPGVAPGATAVHGSWVRAAKRKFLFTVVQVFYGADGSFQGGNKVRNLVTLNSNGNEINGHYQFDISDANGNVVYSGTGYIHASRIQIEPLNP